MRVINLYAGPGVGKSTIAAALFAELKYRNVDCEYITEYAKDATWERRGPKVFQAQEYIFGKQHFRMARVADEVDYVITDSPIMLCTVYAPKDYYLPSLPLVVREAYYRYDNLNILLKRTSRYNPSGRNQTEEEAIQKDLEIKQMLINEQMPYEELYVSRTTASEIVELMQRRWGPDL